jgi:hypothetical protein
MKEQIEQGVFKDSDRNTRKAWLFTCFNSLVGQYQHENNIKFLLLPAGDELSIKTWIDDLANMEERENKENV